MALPHLGLDIPSAARARSTREWSSVRIIACLRKFDRLLPPEANRSQGQYRKLLGDRPEWPAVSVVIRYGGWSGEISDPAANSGTIGVGGPAEDDAELRPQRYTISIVFM